MNSGQPKITQSYINDAHGSRVRVTRLEQELDSTHVVIESTAPASSSRQHPKPSNSREKSKYYIEIDDDDDSNIDVVVNVSQPPQIRSNRRYQANISENRRDDSSNSYNASSRIRIETVPDDDYEYQINYSTQNHNNRHNRPGTSGMEKNYQTCITETHTIKIKNNNGGKNSTYNHHPTQHIHRQRNSNAHNYSDFTYPVPKQRQEKTFGVHTSDVRNMQGRIIKNGDSAKNIGESVRNDKQKIITEVIKNSMETKDVLQKSTKKQDNHAGMQRIKLLNEKQQSKSGTNKHVIDASGKKQSVSNARQFRTEPRTPKNNYENTSDQSLSPIVQEYGNNAEFSYMEEHNYGSKIFEGEASTTRQVHRTENIELPRDESLDKQRVAPVPYDKKGSTLQKQIQRQISGEWPPSIKDIPINSTKIKKNIVESKTSRGNHFRPSDSPIRVPIQQLHQSPEITNRLEEGLASANRQIKRVKIFLNSRPHQGHIHRQITQPGEGDEKEDVFAINKQKYLDKLRKQQRSKSKMAKSKLDNSRTFSRNRYSLSPECERITNRLHKTRTNEQPCPKYVHYKEVMKRSDIKETLGQYSFIRRYLSDNEIGQVLVQLEQQGVPERKWPMRLVDIVYDKLRALKVY